MNKNLKIKRHYINSISIEEILKDIINSQLDNKINELYNQQQADIVASNNIEGSN